MKKIMVDLNVVLDVVQKREPHFSASAQVLAKVSQNVCEGLLPAHALTTIHYIVQKYSHVETADKTIDWLLASFKIASACRQDFLRARTLKMHDFEDAVVAAAAIAGDCDLIVTRNVADFDNAPIQVLTPEEFLADIKSVKI